MLVVSVVLSLTDKAKFILVSTEINNWILAQFDWLFAGTTLFLVLLTALIFFSKFGSVRIGGPKATPQLKMWDWFSITLCTTIATGLLFWGAAEPIFHLTGPPVSLGLQPGSQEAARFSLATVFLHWSFTPYAIYSVPALMFALAFHNRKMPFSLASIFFPYYRNQASSLLSGWVDAICLLSLVLGMAASLGAGALAVIGGLGHFTGMTSNPLNLGIVITAIVFCFCFSALTGLMKGIRFLCSWNAGIFIFLALFILFLGPSSAIMARSLEALPEYFSTFFTRSLFLTSQTQDPWPNSWSIFYWANWLAWAPITALFLGKIAYGQTVRAFLVVNWILPSLFAIVWMSIFSGSALEFQMAGIVDIGAGMKTQGTESAIYMVLQQMPWAAALIGVLVFTTFLSYVTGADANTEAMAAISTKGVYADDPGTGVWIKIVWAVILGSVSWVMVSYSGIEGIKMLSNLGGFPALFLILASGLGLLFIFITGRYKQLL